MHSDYYKTLIHKHLSGELTAEEQQDFDAWLDAATDNRLQFEEAERIWAITASAGSELDIDLDHEISRFKRRIQHIEKETRVTPIYLHPVFRYAAAAAVLLGGVIFLLRYGMGVDESEMIVFETSLNEIRSVTLPDNSTAWLNENSRLAYDASFKKRSVQLNGEAFFEVTHDAGNPFDIASGSGRIQVLGTSFSVRNRPDEDDIRVTVATGRVALRSANADQREVVEAGYQGVLMKTDHTLSRLPNDNPGFLAWRTRPLAFDNTSFGDVVETLRSHYAIIITSPDTALAACTFTGQFDAPALDDVVASLAFSLNVEVAVTQGVYTFTGTGCSQ